MSDQLLIRIDPKIKEKFTQLTRAEGKNNSLVIRELIEKYIRERDMSGYIDDLWDRISRRAEQLGITEKDIERTIREVRAEKTGRNLH